VLKQGEFGVLQNFLITHVFFLEPILIKEIYPVFVERVGSIANRMWDIKLPLIDIFFLVSYFLSEILFAMINTFDPLLQNGFFIFNWKMYYQFAQNMTFFFGIKFLLSISFLILIRGGTPRYRYDYLTKLGWLKFLGFVISVFFLSLILFYIY
jgi:hypothetical protein